MREWEPIGHIPPLPRIDLNPKWRRIEPARTYEEILEEIRLDREQSDRAARIWELVRQYGESI